MIGSYHCCVVFFSNNISYLTDHAQTPSKSFCSVMVLKMSGDKEGLGTDKLRNLLSKQKEMTIIGFGSLMSMKSSLRTFPTLHNFRVVEIEGYRRVFRHPASVFFTLGIADLKNQRISSLCAERQDGHSFIGVAFEVATSEIGDDREVSAFVEREEEFDFDVVEWDDNRHRFVPFRADQQDEPKNLAIVCVPLSDEGYIARWG